MDNPYESPTTDTPIDTNALATELADRGSRLVAAIIDGLIMMVITVPVMFLVGGKDLMAGKPPFMATLVATVVGVIAFYFINAKSISTNGQTVGKKVARVKVVHIDDTPISLNTYIAKRYLPLVAVNLIPVIGGILGLINVLMIFKGDKRCGHDMIANTKVVKC